MWRSSAPVPIRGEATSFGGTPRGATLWQPMQMRNARTEWQIFMGKSLQLRVDSRQEEEENLWSHFVDRVPSSGRAIMPAFVAVILLAAAEGQEPALGFRAVTVDDKVGIGYGVAVTDV